MKNVHLVFAGPGNKEYIDSLRIMAEKFGILERVTFTGILNRQAVREAYHAASIFVLPSLRENFGISVAEAMASGCPVIISDKVDLYVEVREAGAGLVVASELDELANAIMQLLGNEVDRKEMGERGKRLIQDKFSWEKVSEQLTHIYNNIIVKNESSMRYK